MINEQSAGRPSEGYGPRIRIREFLRGTGINDHRRAGYRRRNRFGATGMSAVKPGALLATVTVDALSSVKAVVPPALLPLASSECTCKTFETASPKLAKRWSQSVIDRAESLFNGVDEEMPLVRGLRRIHELFMDGRFGDRMIHCE